MAEISEMHAVAAPTPDRLYLEDLQVGQSWQTAAHVLDEAAIARFAAAFDPQPFHLSAETAAGTFFDGLAASGWHTAAITMRLMVAALPIAGGIIGGNAAIKWPRATRPDDRLRAEIEIAEIRPSRSRPDRGTVKLHVTTRNHTGDAVLILDVAVMVPRRATEA